MSTHAVMGVKFPDGEISGCYVHYDGGTMLPRITDYLRKNTTTCLSVLIAKAQSCGGIRSFHVPPYDSTFRCEVSGAHETELLDDNKPYVIDSQSWHADHFGSSYKYLVDYETGTVSMESKEY